MSNALFWNRIGQIEREAALRMAVNAATKNARHNGPVDVVAALDNFERTDRAAMAPWFTRAAAAIRAEVRGASASPTIAINRPTAKADPISEWIAQDEVDRQTANMERGEIDRRIRESESFLAASRARSERLHRFNAELVDILPTYRAEENPRLWETCRHEAAHACAAFYYGANVVYATVRSDCSGLCQFDESMAKVDAFRQAVITAAGAHAQKPGERMTTSGNGDDGDLFMKEIFQASGEVIGDPNDVFAGKVAGDALVEAGLFVEHNYLWINALAGVLYDRVDLAVHGDDLKALYDRVTEYAIEQDKFRARLKG